MKPCKNNIDLFVLNSKGLFNVSGAFVIVVESFLPESIKVNTAEFSKLKNQKRNLPSYKIHCKKEINTFFSREP